MTVRKNSTERVLSAFNRTGITLVFGPDLSYMKSLIQCDIDFARSGIDFEFVKNDFAADPFVPVRYIRLRTISTFDPSATDSYVSVQEISFWGKMMK